MSPTLNVFEIASAASLDAHEAFSGEACEFRKANRDDAEWEEFTALEIGDARASMEVPREGMIADKEYYLVVARIDAVSVPFHKDHQLLFRDIELPFVITEVLFRDNVTVNLLCTNSTVRSIAPRSHLTIQGGAR